MLKQLLRTVTRDDTTTGTEKGSRRFRTVLEYGTDDASTGGDETDLPEHLLLRPEDRVLTLLEEHGGRMWQQDIAANVEYSVGRVSQLLTEMEANGRITRSWKDGSKVVMLPETGVEETSR